MAIEVYDSAVKAKIKSLFSNTEFQSREFIFKTVTDRKGEINFPLISIFRPDGWSLSSDNTWNLEQRFLDGIHQVKVDLSYQIDIYANTRKDLEELTAELVLYLLRNPGIKVHYESVDKKSAVDVMTYLSYVSGPERTSELDDTTVGRPYRYTLTYTLKSAVLLGFAGDTPGEDGYVTKVTEVIVDVKPEVEVLVDVGSSGVTHKIKYLDKEVLYGKD